MSNLATLQPAPPWSPEEAIEKGRLGGIRSGETRRAQAQKRIPVDKIAEAQKMPVIQGEIHRIVKAMARLPVTGDDYKELASILDKLWNKAFPTQGAIKSRGSKSAPLLVEPIAPQAPPV